jgi:hypothetical protein
MDQGIGKILPQCIGIAKTSAHLRIIGWVFYLFATLLL